MVVSIKTTIVIDQDITCWHESRCIGAGDIMDTLKDKIKDLEKEAIITALKESNWVMAQAARRLGITERMIGYKIKKYGLRIKEVRWLEKDDDRNQATQQ